MEEFDIKLTKREMIILKELMNYVGGCPFNSVRKDVDSMRNAIVLPDVDMDDYARLFTVNKSGIHPNSDSVYRKLLRDTSPIVEMSIPELEKKLGIQNLKIIK